MIERARYKSPGEARCCDSTRKRLNYAKSEYIALIIMIDE